MNRRMGVKARRVADSGDCAFAAGPDNWSGAALSTRIQLFSHLIAGAHRLGSGSPLPLVKWLG